MPKGHATNHGKEVPGVTVTELPRAGEAQELPLG